jgi:hypothetical protein
MADPRNPITDTAPFSAREINFFKRLNPRTREPIRLVEATKPESSSGPAPHRPLNPAHLVALVGFAGILFLLSGAI